MMRIVSINLNQRLGNPKMRSRFEAWLPGHAPEILLAQEPFKPSNLARPALSGYRLVDTTSLISCWIAEGHAAPRVVRRSEQWQEILIENRTLHNVYLSSDSSNERCDFLLAIAAELRQAGTASLVLGDFNLAPRAEDGCFGEKSSRVTKPIERQAFSELIESARLFDATCPKPGIALEFTFERMQYGEWSRFRCDLALISTSLSGCAKVAYDHSTRTGPDAFTDHSAIVVDLLAGGQQQQLVP